MAGKEGVSRLLARHKASLVRDLDVNRLIPRLLSKEIITAAEEKLIVENNDPQKRTETFLELLSKKGVGAFHEFCACLEEVSPHLLTGFLLDTSSKYIRC